MKIGIGLSMWPGSKTFWSHTAIEGSGENERKLCSRQGPFLYRVYCRADYWSSVMCLA